MFVRLTEIQRITLPCVRRTVNFAGCRPGYLSDRLGKLGNRFSGLDGVNLGRLGRCLSPGQFLNAPGQHIDLCKQVLDVLFGRNSQATQRPRHPGLKDLFQLVPCAGGLVTEFAGLALNRLDAFFDLIGCFFSGFFPSSKYLL